MKDKRNMKKEDFKLLNILHDLIAIRPNIVTEEQYNLYNRLFDNAEKLNIVW